MSIRRRGLVFRQSSLVNDVWIAACSAREGATVVTYHRHFEAIHRVGVLVLDAPGGAGEDR